MAMSTIFFLTLLLTIPITILITWIVINRRLTTKTKANECPYKKACEHYDETETKHAARRVARLLLENLESETAYKEAIRAFIENHPSDEPKAVNEKEE